MKRVEAVITQLVTSRAVVILDEHDQIVEIEDITEEIHCEDTQLQSIEGHVDEEDELPDHREVDKW